jgi:hypothetical protein
MHPWVTCMLRDAQIEHGVRWERLVLSPKEAARLELKSMKTISGASWD